MAEQQQLQSVFPEESRNKPPVLPAAESSVEPIKRKITNDEKALDFLVQQPDHPRAAEVAQKLGVGPEDIQAWTWAKQNPISPKASNVRNKVFNKVATQRPAENVQGVGFLDRFAIKNLISTEPELQQKYLERKGYDTRFNRETGDVEVKKPDEPNYSKIDPEGIDVWDVTDLAGDVLEAIITGAAAVTATPVGAGAAGGLAELTRQRIAQETGLRENLNPMKIAETATLSAALPAGLKYLGKGIKLAGKGSKAALDKLKLIPSLKSNADEIAEATAKIGGKATPGQLYDNRLVQNIEDIQYRRTGTIGGFNTRRAIEANKQAAQETAEDLLKSATSKTEFEIGSEVGDVLKDELSKKLAPAELLYDDVSSMLPKVKVNISEDVADNLMALRQKYRFDKQAASFVDEKITQLRKITDLEDLKAFRTSIRGEVAGKFDNVGQAGKEFVRDLTQVRSNSLLKAAEKKGDDVYTVVKDKLGTADKIWRETADEVQNLVKNKGKVLKSGPKRGLQEFLESTPEINRINKILKTNDPAKIAGVEKAFPRAFEQLRQSKLKEITDFATQDSKIIPSRLVKKFNDMPPETANIIFGADGAEKAKALGIYVQSLPTIVNPSGTSTAQMIRNMVSAIEQAKGIGLSVASKFIRSPDMTSEFAIKIGKALQSAPAAGLGQFTSKKYVEEKKKQAGLRNALPTQDLSPLLNGVK